MAGYWWECGGIIVECGWRFFVFVGGGILGWRCIVDGVEVYCH